MSIRVYHRDFIKKHPVIIWLVYSFIIGICINALISVVIFYVKHSDHFFNEFNDGTDLSLLRDYNLFSLPYVIIATMIVVYLYMLKDVDYVKREKNELIYNLGLRRLYKELKRLPKFICKHCLKTIIVKNIDIVCPFCDAEFRVTDDDKSKQIGDVFAKGVRNIVNESTMERILFVGCPACGGKIQHIDCYHCNKEIDIFEEYDELKLERRRYE